MKKLIPFLLVLILVFSSLACRFGAPRRRADPG
jgi:hypothetical protein